MRIAAIVLALAVLQEKPDVEKLCGELGSSEPEAREKAAKELVKIGKPAVAALKKISETGEAEARAQAQVVLAKIRVNLRNKALAFDVAADKKVYAPGEKVTLNASFKNSEDFPVRVLKFLYDGSIHPKSWITVTFDGKSVRYAGDPLPQVMVNHRVQEGRFDVVEPAKSLVVRSVNFEKRWDMKGKDPSLKASYETAELVNLVPGVYTVKATYAWSMDVSKLDELEKIESSHPAFQWKFEGKAKEMLAESWQGSVEAECTFRVE